MFGVELDVRMLAGGPIWYPTKGRTCKPGCLRAYAKDNPLIAKRRWVIICSILFFLWHLRYRLKTGARQEVAVRDPSFLY